MIASLLILAALEETEQLDRQKTITSTVIDYLFAIDQASLYYPSPTQLCAHDNLRKNFTP